MIFLTWMGIGFFELDVGYTCGFTHILLVLYSCGRGCGNTTLYGKERT